MHFVALRCGTAQQPATCYTRQERGESIAPTTRPVLCKTLSCAFTKLARHKYVPNANLIYARRVAARFSNGWKTARLSGAFIGGSLWIVCREDCYSGILLSNGP